MGSRHTMDLPRSMVVPGPSCVHLRSNLLGVQDVDYDGWILCTLGGREGGSREVLHVRTVQGTMTDANFRNGHRTIP